jgi:hypothetical protein
LGPGGEHDADGRLAITTGRWGGVSRWTVSTAWNATFTFFGLAAVVAGDRRDVHPSLTSRP